MHPTNRPSRIPIGGPAWTADGHMLGSVVGAITHVVVVERGWLEREQFVLRAADICRITDNAIHLCRTLAEVEAAARVL